MSQANDPANRETASGPASSSSESPYTASAGPGFDERQTPPEAPTEEAQGIGAFAAEWEQEQVSDWLKNTGALMHAGFGVGEHDWEMTRADLERIAPPATRILNRYQFTKAIAAYSDPAAVAIGTGLWGWRSTLERIAVLQAAREAEEGAQPAQAPVHFAPTEEPLSFADRLAQTRQEDQDG